MKTLPFRMLALGAIPVLTANAQSTISLTDRHAFAANAGWLDFRPIAADGVRATDTALAGFAYAANFGWIRFGSGSPANGHTYSNTSAADHGVNLSQNGVLSGYAYAANVGWITFEQLHGLPRIDLRTGKFSGSAYSANLGWIPLDTTFSDLGTDSISRPDIDGDGIADTWENYHFGNLTTANVTSDRDGDGSTDRMEYNAGTLPLDAGSSLRIVSHTYNSTFTEAFITFTSIATRNYRVEYDTDLAAPWTNSTLGTFPPAGATTAANLTGLSASTKRFFRAVAVPLPSAP